jgi:hypothetical protein
MDTKGSLLRGKAAWELKANGDKHSSAFYSIKQRGNLIFNYLQQNISLDRHGGYINQDIP